MKLKKATIKITRKGEDMFYTVRHNFPNSEGVRFSTALDRWFESVGRRKDFNDKNFCKFVSVVYPGVTCMTKKQYQNDKARNNDDGVSNEGEVVSKDITSFV